MHAFSSFEIKSDSTAATDGAAAPQCLSCYVKEKIIKMLDILPGYYIVFLALGLAAIVVVLFYSFTRNSNYEVQQRAKKIQQRREKENQAK